jgi:hypothetical protein
MDVDKIDLDQQICVIGAGIVGLTTALKLADLGHRVVLVESGTAQPDKDIQKLNEAIHDCDEHADPGKTRTRAVGGTLHQWKIDLGRDGKAGRFLRFEEEDFHCGEDEAGMSWPISLNELLPFYVEAHKVLGLGAIIQEEKVEAFEDLLEEKFIQLESGRFSVVDYRDVLKEILKKIEDSEHISLLDGLTVISLSKKKGALKTLGFRENCSGERFEADCTKLILAAGAIENSRLLALMVDEQGETLLKNNRALGRYFMDHTYGPLLRVKFREGLSSSVLGEFDIHDFKGKEAIGYVCIPQEVRRKKGLPNCALSIIPVNAGLASGISKEVKALLKGDLSKMKNVLTSLPLLLDFIRWKFFGHQNYSAGHIGWASQSFFPKEWMISGVVEQLPDQENRIELSGEKDRLNCGKIKFTWKWRPKDEEKLERLRTHLIEEFQKIGCFAEVRPEYCGSYSGTHHHFGGTRMATEADQGVVDINCQVFGEEGLWVAGTSVFVTSGTANPTLSGMAAALYMVEKNFNKKTNEAA